MMSGQKKFQYPISRFKCENSQKAKVAIRIPAPSKRRASILLIKKPTTGIMTNDPNPRGSMAIPA